MEAHSRAQQVPHFQPIPLHQWVLLVVNPIQLMPSLLVLELDFSIHIHLEPIHHLDLPIQLQAENW